MDNREEALKMMQKMRDSRPTLFFKRFDDDYTGICCVLKYLSSVKKPVSAGEISTFMGVSTARVSVLLRKMQEKGYIVRESSDMDARKSMITLTEKGIEEDLKKREEMIVIFCKVFDRIGKERLDEFISISNDIKKAVEEEIQKKDG